MDEQVLILDEDASFMNLAEMANKYGYRADMWLALMVGDYTDYDSSDYDSSDYDI